MADRPIPFSAPMARALLAGAKSQTRRLGGLPDIEIQPNGNFHVFNRHGGSVNVAPENVGAVAAGLLRMQPGDRLWVREVYFQRGHWEPVPGAVTRKGGRQKWRFVPDDDVVLFDPPSVYRKGRHQSDPATTAWHQRLGRFMPRRHSRLTLIVTDVRVQRLQEISEEDARAEGIIEDDGSERDIWYVSGAAKAGKKIDHGPNALAVYRSLWEAINGPGSWAANPWVAAYTFTVHHCNIDAMEVNHD